MDWRSLIGDLIGIGLTQAEIAKACECSQSNISEIARGVIKDPKHSLGDSLIQLHARRISAGSDVEPAAEPAT